MKLHSVHQYLKNEKIDLISNIISLLWLKGNMKRSTEEEKSINIEPYVFSARGNLARRCQSHRYGGLVVKASAS